MFVPDLGIQAQQGGATLLEIIDLSPQEQIIPVSQLGFLKRRMPGPKMDVFPAYEVIDSNEKEVHAVAKARTVNNETSQLENYYLLADPCVVDEMPSTKQTRSLLSTAPASFDTRTKLLFPQACWILEVRPPFNWSVTPAEVPQKLPSTGRN